MGSSCASWTKRSTVQKYSTFWMFQSSIRSPTRYFWGHVSAICEKLCQIWLTHRNYVQTSQTWLLITGIFYLPSALEIAKNGTDSVWVLLLTGPLCPWWTGLSQATRGTPLRERTFPPSDSIRFFSEGTSGLWSAVRGTACSFFSLLNRPIAAPESPTWAMYSVLPLKITTVAVVPDVLGSPCLVRGQESSRKKNVKNNFMLNFLAEVMRWIVLNEPWGKLFLK